MGKFKTGDVVQLKSGGPAMTVSKEQGNGELFCQWFDATEKYQSQSFESDSLKAYEPPVLLF